jgi:hypothetical protein
LVFYKQHSLLLIVGKEYVPRPFRTALLTVVFKLSDSEMLNKANSENDIILEMHHVRNYEVFSYIDHSLQCYNEN